MAGGTSHPPPILRMSYQVACIIPSGDPAFTVNVSEAGSVHDLKFAIKNSMGVALAAADAVDLKLYQIDVDGFDSIVYIEEVQRLAENLGDLTRLNDLALLSSVIPPPGPPHGRIHILVQGKLCVPGGGVVLWCSC